VVVTVYRRVLLSTSTAALLAGMAGIGSWTYAQPPPDHPAHLTPSATSSTAATARPTVPGGAGPAQRPAAVRTQSIRVSDLTSLTGHDPVGLSVPSIGVRGPVVAVGTDPVTHLLDVPSVTTRIAWWSFGSRPGDPTGSVVLAAHVDYNGKQGLFFHLDRVPIGTVVGVRRTDGSTVSYRVTSRQSVAKGRLSSLGVFRAGGPARLALVTCGGAFDAADHSYRDNIVVMGRPLR
jgi:hypothetical protein